MDKHFSLHPTIAYPLTLVLGVFFFTIGMYKLISRITFIKHGTITQAVTNVLEEKGSEGGTSYHTVFKFMTKQHDTINYDDKYFTGDKKWPDGARIRIAYDERAPYDVLVLTFVDAFCLPIYLLAIGAGAIVVGGGYYLSQKFFKKLGEM